MAQAPGSLPLQQFPRPEPDPASGHVTCWCSNNNQMALVRTCYWHLPGPAATTQWPTQPPPRLATGVWSTEFPRKTPLGMPGEISTAELKQPTFISCAVHQT